MPPRAAARALRTSAQGLTVPHHATDVAAGVPGSMKQPYEVAAIARRRRPPPPAARAEPCPHSCAPRAAAAASCATRRGPRAQPEGWKRPGWKRPTLTPASGVWRRRRWRQVLCDAILRNGSLGEIPSIHPASGGIYCDSCPPREFAETAANQVRPEAADWSGVARARRLKPLPWTVWD